MKFQKKEFEIFNLSFLDIISCGFGAVVLLVLISNTQENPSAGSVEKTEVLLNQVMTLENRIDALSGQIAQEREQGETQKKKRQQLGSASMELDQRLGQKEKEEKNLEGDLQGLSLVQSSLKRASLTPTTSKTVRDEEVGGIPVDSDYVIFVIDTSGSMKEIWRRVSREVLNVLSIHPQVKGFQILNDNGVSLISGWSGKWIPDTPRRRKSVMRVFAQWNDASNSSPIEGIETAIREYGKAGQSMAIYVFGDDYTGGSFDAAVNNIDSLNKNRKTGKRLAKIHGVGFISRYTTNRFAILMRELTKRNGGTFLALSR